MKEVVGGLWKGEGGGMKSGKRGPHPFSKD